MSENFKHHNYKITFLLSVTVFVLFFSYYFFTSNLLPHGAGPDWKSNTDVSRFIYEHGRLAVLPDDEKLLHFTVYGGTRALRPPLAYIASAGMAKLLSFTSFDSHILFRKGSVLLCALAVTLTFYALSLYFSSYGIGILGAGIIGLMPQFTFIASYTNDDSGAIFAATLMFAVLIRVFRYGANLSNAVLVGLASGLIVLAKMSAWLIFPVVALFLIIFFKAPFRSQLRYASIAGLFFILAGGWWFVFNIYHYGFDDPLQKKITNSVIEKHRRLPPDMGVGFAAQGVGFYELLVRNHKNFLGETAKSTIGNLDWLKLKVGPLQYGFYILIFYLALIYYLFSLLSYLVRKFRGMSVDDRRTRQLFFESLLILSIFFQIAMYTWTNIHNDIQIQGKYIIPIFLAILILFFSAIVRLPAFFTELVNSISNNGYSFNIQKTRNFGIFTFAALLILYIHWNAWVNYVIPFYNPPAYDVRLDAFRALSVEDIFSQNTDNLQVQHQPDGTVFTSTGADPKVELDNKICQLIAGNAMLRFVIHANNTGTLQFFVDEGQGYTAKHAYTARYRQGENTLLLPISSTHCKRVRFDPFVNDGALVLFAMDIAVMKIRPARND